MHEPPITDFTSRDFESLVDSLLDLATVRLPEWTDQSENDVGRMLLMSSSPTPATSSSTTRTGSRTRRSSTPPWSDEA